MVGGVDEGDGGFPVDAGVGDGDAVFEIFFLLGEGLVAGVDVAFEHEGFDVGVTFLDLFEDGVEDGDLFEVFFVAVVVAAVDHDGGLEVVGFEFFFDGLDGFGVVVGFVDAAAEDDVAVGVAVGDDIGSAAFVVDAHEGLRVLSGEDGVDGGFDRAVGCIFKAEWHGEAGGELAMGLGLGGAGADGGPANEVSYILRSDGV